MGSINEANEAPGCARSRAFSSQRYARHVANYATLAEYFAIA